MVKKILQLASQYAKAALAAAIQNSGTAALYLGTSTLLAAILTAILMTYAYDINNQKWYRALAILQGIELDEIQQAERDEAAKLSYQDILNARAERLLKDEFDQEITQRAVALPLPPEEPKPQPPPPPSADERIDAYEKRVAADRAKAQTEGLDEQIRLIANMRPDQAKEVISKYWKEGQNKRVIQMLTTMEDKERERILYAMRESNDEELKNLCEILQRIGDGEPMTPIIKDAIKEP